MADGDASVTAELRLLELVCCDTILEYTLLGCRNALLCCRSGRSVAQVAPAPGIVVINHLNKNLQS